jgi:glycine betaine/proline transport system permease protein
MNDKTPDAPAGMISDDSEYFAAEREQQVERFVKTSPGYYRNQFAKIGSDSKFVWTSNLWAGILGPIWFYKSCAACSATWRRKPGSVSPRSRARSN